MRLNFFSILCIGLVFFSCKSLENEKIVSANVDYQSITSDLTIAFGSCNNQNLDNVLWDDVLKNSPSVWIWGGDNVYADTQDMKKLRADYNKLLDVPNYKQLRESVKVLGTWDDHDYGINDGGAEFDAKDQSQQEFLDFFGVSKTDIRRQRKGVYHSEKISTPKGMVNIILLDTRYFRSALIKDKDTKKRYKPNLDTKSTILGDEQWQWLEKELKQSKSDFNLIVSSIQFLSDEHGFEAWGNFPHEVKKLKALIKESKAKGVLLLSGDRHISEFSINSIDGLNYPLIDFTSSGLTHAYSNFKGEPNPYRVGKVVSQISFGLLKFDFKNRTIHMEMRGDNNHILQQLSQRY